MTQFILLALAVSSAWGWAPIALKTSLTEPGLQPVLGQKVRIQLTDERDTLHRVAERQGVGFTNLLSANPGVDPWDPKKASGVYIPLTTIPPQNLQPGITINLAEMRLYHLWHARGRSWLRVYPIGIGRQGLETPEGDYAIISKVKNPTWRVPERARQEDPSLPRYMPPGPDNPLGHRWLGLSAPTYGLHGTNRPLGIGRRISSGCIRLYPRDIQELFDAVQPHTPVRILYQPIKIGLKDGQLFLQVHDDFARRIAAPLEYVVHMAQQLAPGVELDRRWIQAVLDAQSGLPVPLNPIPAIHRPSAQADRSGPNS